MQSLCGRTPVLSQRRSAAPVLLRKAQQTACRAFAAPAAAATSQPGRAPWSQPYASSAQVEAALALARSGVKPVPLVLYFSAPRCGPCKLVNREMDKLRLQYNSKVNILTIDIDTEKELAKQTGISSIPTVLVVGHADPATPAIMTQGNVTAKLLADVLDNKIHLAGAEVTKPRRLF